MSIGFPFPFFFKPIEPVVLPKDELGHEGYEAEWWYFVGSFWEKKDDGPPEVFAFEMTVLRRPSQPDYAFVSFIDPLTPSYLGADRLAFDAYSVQGNGIEFDFEAPMGQPGRWKIKTLAPAAPNPTYELDAQFCAEAEHRALRLKLAAIRDAVIHGDQGRVDFGGVEMGYYSRPRFEIVGGVSINDRHFPVEGYAWMDHQWGGIRLIGRRWQFFAIHLDDAEVLVLRVQRPDGTTLLRFATKSDANGAQTDPTPQIQDDGSVWGPGYPLRHHVVSVPLGIDLEIVPLFEAQRRKAWNRPALPLLTFWEGACIALDNGNLVGTVHMELGGYE